MFKNFFTVLFPFIIGPLIVLGGFSVIGFLWGKTYAAPNQEVSIAGSFSFFIGDEFSYTDISPSICNDLLDQHYWKIPSGMNVLEKNVQVECDYPIRISNGFSSVSVEGAKIEAKALLKVANDSPIGSYEIFVSFPGIQRVAEILGGDVGGNPSEPVSWEMTQTGEKEYSAFIAVIEAKTRQWEATLFEQPWLHRYGRTICVFYFRKICNKPF